MSFQLGLLNCPVQPKIICCLSNVWVSVAFASTCTLLQCQPLSNWEILAALIADKSLHPLPVAWQKHKATVKQPQDTGRLTVKSITFVHWMKDDEQFLVLSFYKFTPTYGRTYTSIIEINEAQIWWLVSTSYCALWHFFSAYPREIYLHSFSQIHQLVRL